MSTSYPVLKSIVQSSIGTIAPVVPFATVLVQLALVCYSVKGVKVDLKNNEMKSEYLKQLRVYHQQIKDSLIK